MRRLLHLAALAAAVALVVGASADVAWAKNDSAGKGKPVHAGKPGDAGDGDAGDGDAGDGGERVLEAAISGATAALIREWFGSHGVSDLDALPPGIRMKLARGGALPPGIAKKRLPGDLLSRLPSYPGREWSRIGRDVVLMERATGIIVDIVRDAL